MMNKLVQQKLFNIFILLLISWASLYTSYNLQGKFNLNLNHQSKVLLQSTFLKQNTNSSLTKSCQKSFVNFCAVLSSQAIANINSQVTVILWLLSILFAKSPIYRIYKPPKFS